MKLLMLNFPKSCPSGGAGAKGFGELSVIFLHIFFFSLNYKGKEHDTVIKG
jgi:hypothetical protein